MTRRGLVPRVHPSFRLPLLGPGGTLHLGPIQSARVWVNWELVRCLAPRLVALAVAEQASPAAELELWRLSPSAYCVAVRGFTCVLARRALNHCMFQSLHLS